MFQGPVLSCIGPAVMEEYVRIYCYGCAETAAFVQILDCWLDCLGPFFFSCRAAGKPHQHATVDMLVSVTGAQVE